MGFGDGDGILFRRFTRSIEVVAHELAHGVIVFSGNLRYYGESGALNEHFGDVFGVLVHQWKRRQEARGADWTIGSDLLFKAATRRALRDMAAPGTAYRDDPFLGDDPQPAHWDDRYRGDSDNGGVHINSGIPNHAFYRASVELGGHAWETLGDVWYQSLQLLEADSRFQDCAEITERETARQYGIRSREVNSVRRGWRAVGIVV
jgi:Zn-dependent metalloprotease